jgi:hypothetical protein
MSSYCDTTSYNSSPDGSDGTTSLSTLPTKKSFLFFCTCVPLSRTAGGNKKKMFYHYFLM